jgi:hypothetical protein
MTESSSLSNANVAPILLSAAGDRDREAADGNQTRSGRARKRLSRARWRRAFARRDRVGVASVELDSAASG